MPQVKEEQPIRIVIPKKEEKKTEEVSKKIEKPLISKEPQIEIKIEPKKVEQPVIIPNPKIEIKKEPKKEQMPIPKPQPEITKENPKKSAIALYWEKMGDKRGKIYDMKAVLK